ncbi:hypothetical protein CH063_11617 [Colletotrichum higginsianum]|uniref:Uncharacterized protein n=1 Tax=Colletotrichum higginsianum (strain IMI 349063) TaxID=759273 RepID=H1VM39_COLHI|nr:hypothetical protein CH063_11617 [Colletotrichum higginsianum]
MMMRRVRDGFCLVMMQTRRDPGVLPRVTLTTWFGPHHFGMNSTRNGRTPCSQTRGKLAFSTIRHS